MTDPDQIVLEALFPYMTDFGYAYVIQEVQKAGGIRNLTDVVAIWELEVAKKKFGNRSSAGQYAAQVRWQGKKPEMLVPEEGVSYRSARVGGKDTQFKVTESTAGAVSSGQIITTGANRVPEMVVNVRPQDKKLEITTRSLNSTNRSTTWIMPNAKVKVWQSQNEGV